MPSICSGQCGVFKLKLKFTQKFQSPQNIIRASCFSILLNFELDFLVVVFCYPFICTTIYNNTCGWAPAPTPDEVGTNAFILAATVKFSGLNVVF